MANVPSIRDMFPDFNDVFSPAFNDFLGVSSYPKVDLVENEKEYKLTADTMYGKKDIRSLTNVHSIFLMLMKKKSLEPLKTVC